MEFPGNVFPERGRIFALMSLMGIPEVFVETIQVSLITFPALAKKFHNADFEILDNSFANPVYVG